MRALATAVLVCSLASACSEDVPVGRIFDRGDEIAASAGGVGDDFGRVVSVSAAGDVYVAGSFQGTVDFGAGPISAVGPDRDAFVASYDAAGELRWAQAYGGTVFSSAEAIVVTGGTVRVLGYWSGSLSTDLGTLDSGGFQAMLLLSLDEAGTLLGTLAFPGGQNVQGKGVSSAAGVFAIGGHYVGNVDLGTGPLGPTPPNFDHGLVAVFDAGLAGPPRVARAIAGDCVFVEGVVVRSDGGVVAAGHFDGTARLGANLTSTGRDAFIAAFDAAGAERWSRQVAATGDATLAYVTADGSDVIVVGTIDGGGTVDSTPVPGLGGADGYAARLADDGTVRWATSFGGSGTDGLNAVAVDAGRTFACGHFSGSITVGGFDLVSSGDTDALVLGLDAGGAVTFARSFGGAGPDDCLGIAVDPNGGDVVVTGPFSDRVDAGGTVLTSAGGTDAYVLRFTP